MPIAIVSAGLISPELLHVDCNCKEGADLCCGWMWRLEAVNSLASEIARCTGRISRRYQVGPAWASKLPRPRCLELSDA